MSELTFLSEALKQHQQKTEMTDYLAFEPFDVKKRESWQYEKAREDGVDLLDPKISRIIGEDPHPFQTGYITNNTYLTIILKGSQVGGSRAAIIRALCQLTGVFPYSLRHDAGVDTGIPRKVSWENLRRWGRRHIKSNAWLTTNIKKYSSYANNEDQLQAVAIAEGWDCGTIIGVGKFPPDLVAREGSEIWIGTYQRAFQAMWNPNLFIRSGRPLLPETLVDMSRGNKGYSVRESTVYLIRNTAIRVITYESGVEKFEAFKAREIILDEEPPTDDYYSAAQERGQQLNMVMTPYRGMTWSRDIIFGTHNLSVKKVFHATQYDSPYCDNDEIEARRINNPLYRRRARVWGLHGEQSGEPYFNRDKLDAWLTRLSPFYRRMVVETNEPWNGIRGEEGVLRSETELIGQDKDDDRYVWRVYEEPVPNTAYMLVTDHAEGAEIGEDAGDWQTGIMFRPPMEKEKWPKVVALIRSSLPVSDFADVCLMMAHHYNDATLCPESDKRGAANAYYHARVRDWPYFYISTSTRWSTRKAQKVRGFDTNAATREKIFKAIEDWMEDYAVEDVPNFYDDLLLTELAQCVKSEKSGRADHKKQKTKKLDLAISYGIGLFVLSTDSEAIRCNRKEAIQEKRKSFMEMIMEGNKKKPTNFARKVFR